MPPPPPARVEEIELEFKEGPAHRPPPPPHFHPHGHVEEELKIEIEDVPRHAPPRPKPGPRPEVIEVVKMPMHIPGPGEHKMFEPMGMPPKPKGEGDVEITVEVKEPSRGRPPVHLGRRATPGIGAPGTGTGTPPAKGMDDLDMLDSLGGPGSNSLPGGSSLSGTKGDLTGGLPTGGSFGAGSTGAKSMTGGLPSGMPGGEQKIPQSPQGHHHQGSPEGDEFGSNSKMQVGGGTLSTSGRNSPDSLSSLDLNTPTPKSGASPLPGSKSSSTSATGSTGPSFMRRSMTRARRSVAQPYGADLD
ncbi:hypothetical protein F5880DRAFT_1520532 [Lentinula raphanica]|nr:hypothetical protein F5880DRAFT_1520532 [Lentinula raphanica]